MSYVGDLPGLPPPQELIAKVTSALPPQVMDALPQQLRDLIPGSAPPPAAPAPVAAPQNLILGMKPMTAAAVGVGALALIVGGVMLMGGKKSEVRKNPRKHAMWRGHPIMHHRARR